MKARGYNTNRPSSQLQQATEEHKIDLWRTAEFLKTGIMQHLGNDLSNSAVKRCLHHRTCIPPSTKPLIYPSGNPNPTSISTGTPKPHPCRTRTSAQSGDRVSTSILPSALRRSSYEDVRRSLTTVCASTPLMKIGTGIRPSFSIILVDVKGSSWASRTTTGAVTDR